MSGKIQMKQKEIDKLKARFDWGKNEGDLPIITKKQMVDSKASLVIVNDFVYDVTEFIDKHPGGKQIMTKYIGLDITSAFNGKVYNHSAAARNWLKTLQIAKLADC
jgi:stearoyl-CoA desaturase (delta-9 desaturase)